MPQILDIGVNGNLIARIMTGNLRGTRYEAKIGIPGSDRYYDTEVDSGIPSQPVEEKQRFEDFRNDFIHARRAIAASGLAADHFKECFSEQLAAESVLQNIMIVLMTNQADRGRIHINPISESNAEVQMVIGTGSSRFPDAIPAEAEEVFSGNVEVSLKGSPLIQTLNVLGTVGVSSLVDALTERLDSSS